MDTRTHISEQHGAMQINKDNWTFWFTPNKGQGDWYPLNYSTIKYWIEKLTGKDRAWFTSVIYE